MLMVTDSGRQNGERGSVERVREKRSEKEGESGWWARADRDSHKIDSLCASPPAPFGTGTGIGTSITATTVASASASSPNFVANLRATKSAPFDFTLIRCRCRAVDEANLPLHRAGTEGDFIFRESVPFLSQQVCFKVTTFFLSSRSSLALFPTSRSCISFRSPLSPLVRHHCLYTFSLSSPLLSPPLLSFYLDLVSRNSALTSIRGRSRR